MLLFAALCVAAGFLNGLLGAGGGALLVPILSKAAKTDEARRNVFAVTVACILPMTLASSFIYGRLGMEGATPFAATAFAAAAGGIAGALIGERSSHPTLKRIFGALLCVSGALMLFGL